MSQIPNSARILFEEAEKCGLQPTWLTKFGLFSIKKDTKTFFIYLTKLSINSSLANYITDDKYTARVVLGKNSFPNIPYLFTTAPKELNHFFDQHQPIIAKPVFGERQQNVRLVQKREDLVTFNLEETIFEKYIPGVEFRYFILKGKVIAAQTKTLKPTPQNPWGKYVANLTDADYDAVCVDIAIKIAKLIGQQFFAVDFIKDSEGKLWILELNSMPGLFYLYHPDEGEPIKIGNLLLEAITAKT